MRLTPLDVRTHRFGRAVRGYDRKEVDDFLRVLADDYESLIREQEALRGSLRELGDRNRELESQEGALREAIVAAQAVAASLEQSSKKEAYLRLAQAEMDAEKILEGSRRQADALRQEIRELRQVRRRVAAGLRATLETHLAAVEGLSADEPAAPSPVARPAPAPGSHAPSPEPPAGPGA
jgi:cell division initiation protein